MTGSLAVARSHLQTGRNQAALAALEDASADQRETADWYALRRWCLARLGRLAEAASAGDRALAGGRTEPEDFLAQANLLLKLNRPRSATEIALQGFALAPVHAFFPPLIWAALQAPDLETEVLDALRSRIIPAPDDRAPEGRRINIPQKLDYYKPLPQLHAVAFALAERCGAAAVHISDFESRVPGRVFDAWSFAQRAFRRLKARHPTLGSEMLAAFVASRFSSLLFAAPACALDVLTSAVMSLGQRPYLLLHESVDTLWHGLTGPESAQPTAASPFTDVIKDSLETDWCLGIVTADPRSADELATRFDSEAIRRKCVVADLGNGPSPSGLETLCQFLDAAVTTAVRLNRLDGRPFDALFPGQRGMLAVSGFDGIVVTNQAVAPPHLAAAISAEGLTQPLVVTTHQLFPEERRTLSAAVPACVITTMADWFDDAELAEIDAQATARLAENPPVYGHENHAVAFNKENLRLRNDLLRQRTAPLLAQGAKTLFASGLGIAEAVWRQGGGIRIEPPVPTASKSAAAVSASDPPVLTVISKDGAAYLLVTPFRRVELADGVVIRSASLPPDLARRSSRTPAEARQALYAAAQALTPDADAAVVTTTVHEFRSWIAQLGDPIFIIIDGYHPPNYSRSYIDFFPKDAVILAREPLSAAWFSRFGWRTVMEPDPLRPLRFSAPVLDDRARLRVLVALNHAGDWSALIHRSDTDRLVEAAGDLAAALPEIDVRVRPHPTMAVPEHEGSGSRARLNRHLEGRALPNLQVSTGTLAEDLRWSTLVLSEYSQVLIDAWAMGKPGVVVNLTGRRSYLRTYEELGFASVATPSALIETVRTVAQAPEAFLARQAAAADRANSAFDAAAGRRVVCPACATADISDGCSHLDFAPARIKHCPRCGHAFAAPEPTDGQLDAYYGGRSDLAYAALIGGPLVHHLRQRAEAQARFIEAVAVSGDDEDAPLLDLGCGMGLLCEAWARRGRSALGLDPGQAVTLAGRRRFHEDLRVQKMEAGIPGDRRWRVIALSHVLEHLKAPGHRLADIRAALPSDGWLFVEVPSLWPGYFEARTEMEGHLHFFSKASLKLMLERHGFEVYRLGTYGPPVLDYGAARDALSRSDLTLDRYDELRRDGVDGAWIRCLARVRGDQTSPSCKPAGGKERRDV